MARDDRLIHGSELDEAISNALGPNALEAIVCEVQIRSTIGGTFTHGITVGLEIAACERSGGSRCATAR